MLDHLSRRARNVIGAMIALALVGFVFGFSGSQRRRCSVCWATISRDEVGIGVGWDWRIPLLWRTRVAHPTPPGVAPFVPTDHVHDRAGSPAGSPFHGNLSWTTGCDFSTETGFARALAWEPGFSEFVADRVADGTIELATVRALIAVPKEAWDAAATNEQRSVVSEGTKLYADFKGKDVDTVDLRRW